MQIAIIDTPNFLGIVIEQTKIIGVVGCIEAYICGIADNLLVSDTLINYADNLSLCETFKYIICLGDISTEVCEFIYSTAAC